MTVHKFTLEERFPEATQISRHLLCRDRVRRVSWPEPTRQESQELQFLHFNEHKGKEYNSLLLEQSAQTLCYVQASICVHTSSSQPVTKLANRRQLSVIKEWNLTSECVTAASVHVQNVEASQ